MSELKAKPVVDGKFWIVEEDGVKIGTLHKKENNRFMLSKKDGQSYFGKKEDFIKTFGPNFFIKKIKTKVSAIEQKEVHGYPTSCVPCNPMYNVQKKLPLFTKSVDSKSLYCAGYYIIKFEKNWAKAFCPKLITIERYGSKGPFKTELEMKQALSNAKAT